MEKLREPERDLATRVLNEVGFEDRLIGYRLRERAGAIMTPLYSFEEIVHLLNDRFPQLNFNRLEKWIRDVMGDEELAARIKEAIEQKSNDHDRTHSIRILMGERLCQCKKAVHSRKLRVRQ
jgi:hypothetical protein